MIRSYLTAAVMLALVGCQVPLRDAHAADVSYIPPTGRGFTGTIKIMGGLSADDAGKFLQYTDRKRWTPPTRVQVELESLGGDLVAAFIIGDEIRRNNWDTVVFTGVKCHSACALIWLSGRYRYFETGALVGFHQPINAANRFTPDKPMSQEWAMKTRAYIDRNGYASEMADFALSEPPNSIRYLGRDDVVRLRMSNVIEFDLRTNFLRQYDPLGAIPPR